MTGQLAVSFRRTKPLLLWSMAAGNGGAALESLGVDMEPQRADSCLLCKRVGVPALRRRGVAIMSDTADASVWYALNRFEVSYWYDVDFNGGCRAHEFYLSDGVFSVGDNHFTGHEKIRAFYIWRLRRGPMTTRHLINNLQVESVENNHARLIAVLSLYRGNGRAPITGARPPCLIADVIAECVRDDRGWRYQSHVLNPTFIGSDIPLSISIDTQILSEKQQESIDHA
jgi:hypothetical protein